MGKGNILTYALLAAAAYFLYTKFGSSPALSVNPCQPGFTPGTDGVCRSQLIATDIPPAHPGLNGYGFSFASALVPTDVPPTRRVIPVPGMAWGGW